MPENPRENQEIDGRFRLIQELSQGSVGAIWSAEELLHGKTVALKLLRPEVAGLPHLRRRFAREARAASRLLHRNISAIFDYGTDEEGRMYIAMELLEGRALTEFIQQGLSLQHILDLTDQLLAGLAHAHARGVIHRDLKPANLMVIDADLPLAVGTLKIVDFGIARMQSDGDARETAHDEVVGTPRYMSPEQAAGERQLGPRTDLYNVGLILYELIAGRPPFGDEKGLSVMASHVHDELPRLEPRADLQLPAELTAFVERALEKKTSDRWSSAAEMRGVIQELLEAAQDDPAAMKAPAPVLLGLGQAQSTVEESAVLGPLPATDTAEIAAKRDRTSLHGAVAGARQHIPFVGRRQERQALLDIVEGVRATQHGKVVLLDGEAGVGKTRLTIWLKEVAEEEGLLHGHIGAFTRGNTEGMRGLREVLDSIFGTRRLPRQEVIERLTSRLARWGYDDSVDVRRIADFMRPPGPDSAIQTMPFSPTKLFAVLAKIFELAAQSRPRLIIFDDLQWAGREVGDFLDYLAVEMRHRPFPLVIMGTIRTEDLSENPALAPRLAALSRYTGETVERLNLGRLTPENGRELVRYVLPVEDELCDVIYERSGGNPLHLVLLLRYLRQEGLLTWDGKRWVPDDEDAVRAAVPPSLADLFRVRLRQVETRYGAEGRLDKLLQRAAIAGPRFIYDVLHEMVESEAKPELLRHFDDDFDRLLSEGLLIESHGRRQEWYAFSHGVVRDFFLTQVGGARRARKLHRLAALAREKVYEDRADSYAAQIAAHWEAAGEREKALNWYLRAARAARRSTALRQAASASRAALRVMDSILDLVDDEDFDLDVERLTKLCQDRGLEGREYIELLVQLGDLYEGFGEFEAAESYNRRVVRMVGSDEVHQDWVRGALAESWLGLGHITWQRGDFDAAKWAFQRVCDLVAGIEVLEPIGASAWRGLARVAWHRGDYEQAQELAGIALESARRRDDIGGEAKALWGLGEVARIRGDGESARLHFEASQKLYNKSGDLIGLARNLLSRAQVARYQKNFLEAEELYQRSLRRYQAVGHRRGAAQCLNGLGDVARFNGDHSQAQTFYDRALAIYEAMGAQYDVALVYTNLGLTAMRLNDFDAAKGFLEAARGLVAGEEYPYLQSGVEFNLALVEALRGDQQESTEILERVLHLSERFPIPDLDYAQPLEELGRLRSEAGHAGEAMELWERARDIYRELALTDDRLRLEKLMEEQ